jgi:hypothetical protein
LFTACAQGLGAANEIGGGTSFARDFFPEQERAGGMSFDSLFGRLRTALGGGKN